MDEHKSKIVVRRFPVSKINPFRREKIVRLDEKATQSIEFLNFRKPSFSRNLSISFVREKEERLMMISYNGNSALQKENCSLSNPEEVNSFVQSKISFYKEIENPSVLESSKPKFLQSFYPEVHLHEELFEIIN